MTMAGVPPGVVAEHKPYLSNMLGLIRGNIYYNLMSWYRCLMCLPVGDTSKYMETMMGVRQVKKNGICINLKIMLQIP
jgi:pyruvate,water dikinase